MMKPIFVASVLASASASNPKWLEKNTRGRNLGVMDWDKLDAEQRFNLYVDVFEKSYDGVSHKAKAFESFANNDKIIDTHNSKNLSYTLGHNEFSDLSQDEFKTRMGFKLKKNTFLRTAKNRAMKLNMVHKVSLGSNPDAVDWVSKGAVTAVKNQGSCGSCWSFSSTGAIEGAYAISSGSLVSLSEQQLVSCDTTDNGCGGGMMDNAFTWVKKNGGLCTESSYPYESSSGSAPSCVTSSCSKAVTITGHTDVAENDESALEDAVAQQPVSVAIEADQSVFQLYESGVLKDSSCGTALDHGVLVVGYGTDSGTKYWKVKNSWGSTWGEEGYIRMEKDTGGSGMCGVASIPSYPTGAKAVSSLSTELKTPFERAIEAMYAATTPTGTYKGTKSVLGQSVDVTVKIDDASHFDFDISGVATLSCKNEEFSLSGGNFVVPGATKSGDCIHDALSQNNVALSSMTYDATSDEISVSVKYESFLTVSVVLSKQ
jgi:C1A family cysteine protease